MTRDPTDLGDGFRASYRHEPGETPQLWLYRDHRELFHVEIPPKFDNFEDFFYIAQLGAQIWQTASRQTARRLGAIAAQASFGGDPDD